MFSVNKKREVIKSNLYDVEFQPPTTIAEGVSIKNGKLRGPSGVKISGEFFGDVEVEGVLIVAGSGSLHGNIKADDVKIYGLVVGDVSVKGKVHVYPAGSLSGNVSSSSLVADEGATFIGKSNIAFSGLYSGGEKLGERNTPTFDDNECT